MMPDACAAADADDTFEDADIAALITFSPLLIRHDMDGVCRAML